MLPQVTFRGLAPSPSIVESVWKKARKLSELEPTVRSCHVVIEATSSHGPEAFKVTVQLGGGTAASRRSARHASDGNVHVALRDAFRATRRQLQSREKHARSTEAAAWRSGLHSPYA
jgi:hypothetical protein